MKIRLRSRKNATAKVAGAPAKLLNPLLVFIGIFVLYNLLGLVDVPWNISGAEAPGRQRQAGGAAQPRLNL